MWLRLSEPELMGELIAHLRQQGFLVVQRDRQDAEVSLLNPVNERYDRAKTEKAIREWRELHSEAEVHVRP